MKHVLEQAQNITIFQAMVEGLIVKKGKCIGINTTMGLSFHGRTVVVTTGTFLRALLHIGKERAEGGRLGEKDTSDTITKTENETLYPALPKRVSFICKPKLT